MTLTRALLLAAALSGCSATPFQVAPHDASRDAGALEEIRRIGIDGDWLVVRGYHLSDNLVATITNQPFSHAAVLDRVNDRVIEAESVGVHFTPLAEFVAKSHRVILVRSVWSSDATRNAAIAKARSVVGRPYDFLGLVGVGIPDRYYCSSLAVEIYRPYFREGDRIPRPVEPGQLHYWGRILYDSGAT